jgi:hypothetical protein
LLCFLWKGRNFTVSEISVPGRKCGDEQQVLRSAGAALSRVPRTEPHELALWKQAFSGSG